MRRPSGIAVVIIGCSVIVVSLTGPALAQPLKYRVAFATYLGGSQFDQAREVIVDRDGSIVVGAQSASADMPTSRDAAQPNYAGDDPNLGHGGVYGGDCYVARLAGDGSRILAATYLGGSKQERNVYGMELDHADNIVITSMTRSADIPVTRGCFQARHGGGQGSCFVAKLSSDMKTLRWCTYLGGSGDESPRGGLALDVHDNVCIFGTTASVDFPTTAGAFQRKRKGRRDAFVAKLKSDGSQLVWSTLYGGSDVDFMLGGRVDTSGDVVFTGHAVSSDLPGTAGAAQSAHGGEHDAYLAKISKDGSQVRYATYLGGRGNEFPEHRPWLCSDGSVLVPGVTTSADFPVTIDACQTQLIGSTDAFLTKVAPDGKRFTFSTLLGGSVSEFSLAPVCDASGRIFLVGQTESPDLPVTGGAIQPRHGGGKSDGWFAILDASGSKLLYCTYLGGNGNDMVRGITLGPAGEVLLVGSTGSANFPITPGVVQPTIGGAGDAYVVKLEPVSDR